MINEAWFEARLREAVAAREDLRSRSTALRLVFGEADRLPGLIVDQYGDYLVCEILSAGMEQNRELIARLLMKVTGAKGYSSVRTPQFVSVKVFRSVPA